LTSVALRTLGLLLLALLAGCAPTPPRAPDSALLQSQLAREQILAARPAFVLTGRIAVSGQGEGGSGSFEWRQNGEDFQFSLRSPVARQTWSIQSMDGNVRLDGLDGGPRWCSDPETLLADEIGWSIPVRALRHWVRGARAPHGPAEIWFDAEGRPARLRQDGWQVDYRDWFAAGEPSLPRRLFAERGDSRVRLVVERWTGE
jgi:outer membrane lipoprotein LolB